MKHCTTDKCPQILDSSCVFYEGSTLLFSGINTNDSIEIVIQKLNLKLESISGINLDNYYNKQDINNFLSYKADISRLSQVAFSGDYLDLNNKPNIPTKTSDLENDSEFITIDEVPSSETTSDVTSTTTVGAINAGETIEAGTNIQELVQLLFDKTFYPTYSNYNFSLTNNAGSLPKEVGSTFNITLTFNFNRGEILGNWVNGIWQVTAKQADRLGAATSYSLNGVSSPNNSASFGVTTRLGTNKFEGTVTYGEGAQPKDSKGNLFGSPDGGGISPIQSTSFEGIYPYFYYKSTSPITPEIMQSAIANGQATKVVASSTGTITIPFKADGEYIAVAYPATSTTKKAWYVTEVDKGKIELGGGVFGLETTLLCSDSSTPKLWEDVYYKIHVSPGLITQDKDIQLRNQFS